MESSKDDGKIGIEKLDGSNYNSWKFNMKLMLINQDLYGFIEDSEVPTDEKEVKLYKSRSQKAYSLIALSLSKSLQVHVRNTTNPKTAWDAIKSQFEFVSVQHCVRVNRQFYAATMKEETDLLEHITHMTSMAEELRELKEEVSTKKFAVILLGSLPDSYDNFMVSLSGRDANLLTWESIKPALMEEYMRRKEKETVSKSEDAYYAGSHQQNENINYYEDANFAGSSGSRGGGYSRGGHRGGRSGRGGRGGGRAGAYQGYHQPNLDNRSANYQPLGSRGASRGNSRGGSMFKNQKDCWRCGEIGHISAQCPQQAENANLVMGREEGNSSKRVKFEDDLFLESDVALVAASNVESRSGADEWFVDSAASSHMTFDKKLIAHYIESDQPKKVFLGNDTWISSVGEGKVRLPIADGDRVVFVALHRVVFVPDLAEKSQHD